MDRLRDQFLAEGRELLQAASRDLATLSGRPSDPARIDSLFRALHTLKGSTGLFDLKPLGDMLHAAEDLLDALRRKRLAGSLEIVRMLVGAVDQAARWLDAFEAAGTLPPDAPQVGGRLGRNLRRMLGPDEAVAEAEPSDAEMPAWLEPLLSAHPEVPRAGLVALRYVPDESCFFTGDDPLAILKTVPGLCSLSIGHRQPWGAAQDLDPFRCNLIFEALVQAAVADVQAATRMVGDQVEIVALDRFAPAPETSSEAPVAEGVGRTLRVDVERIDTLGHIADELVIANNALADIAAQARRGVGGENLTQALVGAHLRLDRLIGTLHRGVARVRLVPLATLFQRFPHHVREIAERLGKSVSFTTQGETIEIDKSLVDGLFEPILHVLRNAVDHGIEPLAARRAAGKRDEGAILLSAQHVGDHVVIEVADDGRGIDAARIRAVALARGLLTDEAIAALSDEEAIELVFLAGFTTADAVTELSGRGVGMDAVRTAVQRLGGRATLSSTPGAGTSIRFAMPATVMMSNVIVVFGGGEMFGLPMDRVIEMVRVPADRIMPVRNGRAIVLRDTVIPVAELAALLGLSAVTPPRDAMLVIVRGSDGPVAILVDEIADRLNLLVRPLSGLLAGMAGVSGAATLADGRVLVVLDLPELIG